MPRVREVDPAVAVDRAMAMFWTNGYANTSMDRLVRDTGASRYGLYSTFGSKHELLTKALELYAHRVANDFFSPLESRSASLPEIREVFRRIQARLSRGGTAGCLNCNIAVELGQSGSAPARRVGRHFKRVHLLFELALSNAREDGRLPNPFDVARFADYLLGVTAGSFLLARAHMGPKVVEAFLKTALDALENAGT